MLQIFMRFLSALLQSLFISIIMFVVMYSLITRQFPPNFGKLKQSWNNLQSLSQGQATKFAKNGDPGKFENDMDELEALYKQRRILAQQILPAKELGNRSPSAADSGVLSDVSSEEFQSMKEDIRKLKEQTYKLQLEVVTLKNSCGK